MAGKKREITQDILLCSLTLSFRRERCDLRNLLAVLQQYQTRSASRFLRSHRSLRNDNAERNSSTASLRASNRF